MILTDAVLRSAMASKLAYAKNTHTVATFPVSRLLLPEKSKFEVIDCSYTGAHAYTWKTGVKSTVIAFRGSHDITDICSYLNAYTKPFSFCDRQMNVHHCIHDMFMSIEPRITERLHVRQHVTFCGHSLGGAIAMFASAYYAHMSNRNMTISCHTFGTPKVGNSNFLEWFTEYVPDYVNVQNKYDIVTYYPFNNKDYTDVPSLCFDSFSHDLDKYIENIVDNITTNSLW